MNEGTKSQGLIASVCKFRIWILVYIFLILPQCFSLYNNKDTIKMWHREVGVVYCLYTEYQGKNKR